MKKVLKRIIAGVLAGVMMMTVSATVFAEKSEVWYETTENYSSEMFLISEEITSEDGYKIISRTYSSVNPKIRGVSGSGIFKHEKELVYINHTLKYWVQGYFTWNQDKDTATVSNVDKGFSSVNGVTVSNEKLDYKSNQGATSWFGNKYAYARYSFTATNPVGLTRTADIYIDVNVKGEFVSR